MGSPHPTDPNKVFKCLNSSGNPYYIQKGKLEKYKKKARAHYKKYKKEILEKAAAKRLEKFGPPKIKVKPTKAELLERAKRYNEKNKERRKTYPPVPAPPREFKSGDIREDGKVFRYYYKTKTGPKEMWSDARTYQNTLDKMKTYKKRKKENESR